MLQHLRFEVYLNNIATIFGTDLVHSFVGWDIDGDLCADFLPATTISTINA